MAQFVALGCATAKTSHENYLESLRGVVGRDFRTLAEFRRFEPHALPNGNIEYRWTRQMLRRSKPCTDIFEVDPRTYIILRADFIGGPDDCVIPI